MALRPKLWLMALILLPFALAAEYVPAQADQEWGAYEGWNIKSFTLEGMPEKLGGDLMRGLALSGQWNLVGGRTRPAFSATMLAEDLARIRLYLARHGYPAAVVEPIAETEPEKRKLALTFQVTPGEPIRIGRLILNGWPDTVAFPDTTGVGNLEVGNVTRDVWITEARDNLNKKLLDSGYAKAEVTYTLESMGLGLVAVVFTATPGEFYRITQVEILGCSEDLMGVARRVMNISPGVDYSLQVISNASLDLRSTQLFSMVNIQVEPVGPGELKLVANLDNSRMRTLEAGVGTYSDNPWLVRGGWGHRNLFGHGVGFDVLGVLGAHRLGVGAGVNWLGFLSPRAKTRAGLGFLIEDEDAYLSHEARAEFIQSFRPRRRDLLNIGLTVSNTDVNLKVPEATGIPVTQGRLLEIWTDMKWDRTDDPLFPRGGGYVKTSVTVAPPGFISEIPYVSVQADASAYRSPLHPIVLAGRVRVGWAKPLGDATAVLATRRFYAGGYNTHRGYGRRKLGPLDAGGNALGGEFVGLAGFEIRLPLFWLFDAAFFTDAGQVWDKPSGATLKGFPVSIGFDLDLRTPLGPVRGGYGWSVANRIEGQPRDIFHFGIGYPW